MARDYAIVSPQFWTGTTGREIRTRGRDVQLVALYLMTSPHARGQTGLHPSRRGE